MAWDPTRPGIARATRAWLLATIRAGLTNLNLALAHDNLLSVPITSAMVMKGDPKEMPSVVQSPVWISVYGGGDYGTDMESEQIYTGPSYKNTISSTICVYLHPEAIPIPSADGLESGRQELLDCVCDWLRGGVFNTAGNVYADLTSYEYSTTANDRLNQSHIKKIEQDWTTKGFAGSIALYHARLTHTAWLAATAAS